VTGFLGPNGSGKSTTMRMILGLDAPDRGEALIGGVRYRDLVVQPSSARRHGRQCSERRRRKSLSTRGRTAANRRFERTVWDYIHTPALAGTPGQESSWRGCPCAAGAYPLRDRTHAGSLQPRNDTGIEMIQIWRKNRWTSECALSFTVGWWQASVGMLGRVMTSVSRLRPEQC